MDHAESYATLRHGYSIQGGRVIANNGQTWHVFDTHAEAVAAVKAFERGLELGKKIGAREQLEKVRAVLGINTVE